MTVTEEAEVIISSFMEPFKFLKHGKPGLQRKYAKQCVIKHCELMMDQLPLVGVTYDTGLDKYRIGKTFYFKALINELKSLL